MLYGKEYWRQCKPQRSKLERGEIDLCVNAVDRFRKNPWYPGLRFESLGRRPDQNHWSIRGSRALRVILAVELNRRDATRFAPVNMGHHDPTYAWAERQGYYTDLNNPSLVFQPPGVHVGEESEGKHDSAAFADFEEWMLFLPAHYKWLVRRYHSGPARIRGAAGTGKTVIALHRAARLGHRYRDGRILVTTFSRSLCNHMEALFRRMPDPPKNVDFLNIDRLAYKHSASRSGIEVPNVDDAFDEAYKLAVPADDKARLGKQYLREEISRVIKGRDTTKQEYLDTGRFERLGRIRSFKKRDREICWQLRETWDRLMHERGLTSFEDRLVEARNRVWDSGKPRYRSAIIDEGQDMTLVGVQLVRALVAGKPGSELPRDGFLMLDDTAQRIYAGGYRPKWAGLNYTGNSRTIQTNFRNSQPIFEAARAVRGDALIGKDANDDGAVGDVEFERSEGKLPQLLITKNLEARAIMGKIRELVQDQHFKYEEVGVFTRRNKHAEELEECFRKRGIPCDNLRRLAAEPLGPGVRVGTFDRAKGLEFRAVLIARLGKSQFPFEKNEIENTGQATMGLAAGEGDVLTDEMQEVRQLHVDRLYAAMTRARELLYLIADESPCEEIDRARRYFRCKRV